MALPLYLALTAAEMAGNPLPVRFAYMALHFSPGGAGLSGFPATLPPGSVLILDDSTPLDGHDPERILKQLSAQVERWQCEAVLLDFQRPGIHGQRELADMLVKGLPCPVGVSEPYAQALPCPAFLPPVPPDRPLKEYLAPWQGREIWLEAALESITLTLTEQGCTDTPLLGFHEQGMHDVSLDCHYTVETTDNSAIFRLWRTREDLNSLLEEAQKQSVTKAVGLWQELG